MCGIVAYIGKKEAYPIIIKGLKRLEYRGYDSAGVALFNEDLRVYKKKGKVNDLVSFVKGKNLEGHVGIGHTRWATHGEPNDINAHPHTSDDGRLTIIHNGIIENYATLKEALIKEGHTFTSDTDTEVLIHLIGTLQDKDNLKLEEAVRIALSQVVGAYAIVILDKDDPTKLVAARKASPLVLGIGQNEFFLASDATPLVGYTSQVVYLNDEEIAVVSNDGTFEIKTFDNEIQTPYVQRLNMNIEKLEKGDYEHFMLKEIYEQPNTIADCMRGRVNAAAGWLKMGGIEVQEERIFNAKRFIMAACGTSWHAALIGEYLFEELARIPVEVEYASELRYRNPIINKDDVVIALSQSGETADTMAALELAKEKGALIYGIVNSVGSSISRITDSGSYIHAGPEIGVASTKAFTGQVTALTLMAIYMGYKRGTIPKSYYHQLLEGLEKIPAKVKEALECDNQIKKLATKFINTNHTLYLGRGYNFPVALEGALKLKEISYIHAEGYPAAEMKHGPIALIDENMPVVVIATRKGNYHKVVSNIMEIKARGGKIIAVVSEGDEEIEQLADHIIEIPDCHELIAPIIANIPLQLLSYHIANKKGCDIDQPRNLAKSVTVE